MSFHASPILSLFYPSPSTRYRRLFFSFCPDRQDTRYPFPDIVSSLSPQMAISSLLLGPPEARRGWPRWRETVCLPFLETTRKSSREKLVPRELEVCNSARLVSGVRSFRWSARGGGEGARGGERRGPTVNRADLSAIDKITFLYCSHKLRVSRPRS